MALAAERGSVAAVTTNGAIDRRILILGAPRSGTTWTSEILGTADGVRLVHEPDNEVNDAFALLAKRGLTRFPVVDSTNAPDRFVTLWREAFEHGAQEKSPRTVLATQLMRRVPRSVRDEVLADLPTARSRAMRLALQALAKPRSAGKPARTVIVKSVHAAFCSDLIAAIADPKFVIIRRHPLNVLSSWISFGWPPQGLERRPEVVALAGAHDVEPYSAHNDDERRAVSYAIMHLRFERLIAEHPDWVVVDHDEVCSDPPTQFRRLFEQLDLQWTDRTERAIEESNAPGSGYDTRRLSSEQRNAWRERLTPDQVATLAAILEHFGIPVAVD